MGLRFVEYRRRQWVLRYRDPWSGKQRIKSFSTEGEARQFESVQAEMHIRERELMRRAKRRMSSASATKATVAELLERYAGTLENPTTRSTTTQHAEPLTARRTASLATMCWPGAKCSASAGWGSPPCTAA